MWGLGRPKATHKEEEVEDEEEILDEAETVVLGRHLLLAGEGAVGAVVDRRWGRTSKKTKAVRARKKPEKEEVLRPSPACWLPMM